MSTSDDSRAGVVRISRTPGGPGGTLARAARERSSTASVVETGPTGLVSLEPLVLCTHDGRTAIYPRADADDVRACVDELADGRLPTDGAESVVAHDVGTETLPTPDAGPLAVGDRGVLGPCGWVDPEDPKAHAFLDDVPVERVADLGLLGRGRGDAATDRPVFEEWAAARDADGEAVVVVNANEADERSLADETLIAGAPLTVLDAAQAVATFVGASDVVVYANESADATHERLGRALDAASEAFSVVPELVTGPDAFRAGEETMALEAMEGADRVEARIRPPGPAEHGLYGRPTVVHTPRTFAQVYRALSHPEAFDPDDADPGARLVTVTGDVTAPATVELPTGSSLDAVIEAVDRSGFAFAVVGGQFGGFTSDLAVPVSAPSLRGAGLGTNGVVELFDDSRCVVAEAGARVRFAEAENCGRCVPCREGSTQLLGKLRDVYDGEYDADGLRELARVMRRASVCDFGVAAARPVTTALDEFDPEFDAHANGRCPSGSCEL